jgi:hypothetical protein
MIQQYTVRGLPILLDVDSKAESWRGDTYASKEPETLDGPPLPPRRHVL